MARRPTILVPESRLTVAEVQRIAKILSNEGIVHQPMPGDEYLYPDHTSRTHWSRLFVRDHEHRLQPDDLWVPNERQLLMILASLGIPIGVPRRIATGQYEAWVVDDPSLTGTGSSRDEALFHLWDQVSKRRMEARDAEARRKVEREASSDPFDRRIFRTDEWDF